jgi:hypothetical protein
MWGIYALGQYELLEEGFREQKEVTVLGVAAGLAIILWRYAVHRKSVRKMRENNEKAVQQGTAMEVGSAGIWGSRGIYGLFFKLVLLVGIPLFCTLFFFCWAVTINAWFDHSPPEFKRVKIVDLLKVTHNFIFSEYELKYSLAGETKVRSRMSTPQQLGLFLETDLGEAEIHQGALGWKWVKGIRPVKKANF